MAADLTTAKNEMFSAFKVAWDANTPGVTPDGSVPYVYWDGVPDDTPPPPDAPYARIRIRHGPSEQASLAGAVGSRRFERFGTITVQVFTPLSATDPPTLGENLAAIARAAYEGQSTASQVWFRNVRANEIGEDGPWYQWNVVAEFRYDELV
jgi:hypothetical protein